VAARPGLSRVEAAIDEYPIEPGRKVPLGIEGVDLLKGRDEGVLNEIFGIFRLTQKAHRDSVRPSHMTDHKGIECRGVATLDALRQLGVGQFCRNGDGAGVL
jgi:hypothetical protein